MWKFPAIILPEISTFGWYYLRGGLPTAGTTLAGGGRLGKGTIPHCWRYRRRLKKFN